MKMKNGSASNVFKSIKDKKDINQYTLTDDAWGIRIRKFFKSKSRRIGPLVK